MRPCNPSTPTEGEGGDTESPEAQGLAWSIQWVGVRRKCAQPGEGWREVEGKEPVSGVMTSIGNTQIHTRVSL